MQEQDTSSLPHMWDASLRSFYYCTPSPATCPLPRPEHDEDKNMYIVGLLRRHIKLDKPTVVDAHGNRVVVLRLQKGRGGGVRQRSVHAELNRDYTKRVDINQWLHVDLHRILLTTDDDAAALASTTRPSFQVSDAGPWSGAGSAVACSDA